MNKRISNGLAKSMDVVIDATKSVSEVPLARMAMRQSFIESTDIQDLTQKANQLIDTDTDESTSARFRMAALMGDNQLVAELIDKAQKTETIE